jgi:uncharacterized protein (DUF2062 family)
MVGKFFVPGPVTQLPINELINLPILDLLRKGGKWLMITTLGGSIVGLPLAVLTYFLSLRGIRMYQAGREKRRQERECRALRKK